jgi:hypothetical protein
MTPVPSIAWSEAPDQRRGESMPVYGASALPLPQTGNPVDLRALATPSTPCTKACAISSPCGTQGIALSPKNLDNGTAAVMPVADARQA